MFFLLLALINPAAAGDGWVGGGVDLNSRYQWRGLHFSEGPVLQGTLEGGFSNLTVGAWTNLSLGFGDDKFLFDELDLYTTWAQSAGDFWFAPGFTLYTFPGLGPATGEVLLDLGWQPDTFGVQGEVALDVIDNSGGFWGQLEAVYSPGLNGGWGLEILAGLGAANARFNDYYAGLNAGGLNATWLQVGIDRGLSSRLTATLWVRADVLINEDLRTALGQPLLNPVGGLSLAF